MVVSFCLNSFHPYLGKIPILTHVFSTGLESPRLEYVLVRRELTAFGEVVVRWVGFTFPKKPSGGFT